jgi:hypothetical protein
MAQQAAALFSRDIGRPDGLNLSQTSLHFFRGRVRDRARFELRVRSAARAECA